MIRKCSASAVLATPLLFLLTGIPSSAQGQLDGSASLFTVMAAINAAGYDADLDSTANSPLRNQVREYLAQRKIECLPELKAFFAEHKQKNASAELSQYVSFALTIEDPPKFEFRYKDNEIPPDVMGLWGFNELLARFYEQAGIAGLWAKVQPAYEHGIAAY